MKLPLNPLPLGYVGRHRFAVNATLALVVATFMALHLWQLPRSLEDVDSINLAMGVRQFDVAKHQPHPPGYPAFIALAKVSTPIFRAIGSEAPEARGLAIWGVLAGAFAVLPLFTLFRRIDGGDGPALAAAIVSVTAPLFWFTANRPLTDVTGLAAALVVQALAVTAWRRQRAPLVPDRQVARLVLVAAFAAGLIIGLRSQTFLLTLPFGAWLIADPRVPVARRRPALALAAFAVGVLLWAIPLLVLSGGPTGYLAALNEQAREDFTGVTMLWTHPSLRLTAYALRDTLLRPWAITPFGVTMLGLAAIGALVVWRRSLEALLLIAVLTLPYAVFHLLFQETVTVRYALPLVPAVAYLAVTAVDAAAGLIARLVGAPRAALLTAAAAGAITVSLSTAMPALRAYASAPSPAFRALADMRARASATPDQRHALLMHFAARRAVEWTGMTPEVNVLPSEPRYEWLAAVDYWLGGGREPLWFLARPARTDLALFDPRHLQLVADYAWPLDTDVYLGGSRPNGVDWYVLDHPQWFLDKGWSLTPETAGVAAANGDGPNTRGSLAYLARTTAEMTMMLGGYQIGPPGSVAKVRATIDGRPVLEWLQEPGIFLKLHTLSAGQLDGDGAFARLEVTSTSVKSPAAPIKLEQFDLATSTRLVWGYGDGWMEPEYDPVTRRLWRWSSGRATLRLTPKGAPITVRITGESPIRETGKVPTVIIRAGSKVLDTFRPAGGFERQMTVSEDVLKRADGVLTVEADTTFVPDEKYRNGDHRRLGLKIFRIAVR